MEERPVRTEAVLQETAAVSPHPAEGGDLLLAALSARGVARVFSVSGGPINSVYHAATRSPVEICHVRHEAAAGFMADASARVTGVPGVALVTLGPGVTNTVTAVATALRGGSPVLVVGGQVATGQRNREAGMALDTLPVMRPLTKWAAEVLDVDRIPEYVDEAWRRMLAGRPGPAYLEIPVDVLSAPAAAKAPAASTIPELATLSREGEQALAAALGRSQRRLVLAGDDVHVAGAGRALSAAVERHELAFATLRLARGAVDECHPLCLGPGYCPANPVLRRALGEADLVLLLGHTWEFDLDFGASLGPQAVVVQSHPDPALLGCGRRVDVALAANARAVLDALVHADGGAGDAAWSREIAAEWRAWREQQLASAPLDDRPMHPVRLVEEVIAAAPDDTIFVTSHGNFDFWADAYLQVRRPGSYLRAGQLGPLGAEIPYGIAAKLARPKRPVVVFVGDGGFGYHAMELETAARAGAPVVVVVADDERWGAIALPQQMAYGVEVAMDLPRREWARLIETIGGHGEVADTAAQVGPALRRALGSGRPAVVHARIASVLSPYMAYIS
jgi:acetolactate synthase-1/2/3 large subunit